MDLAHATVEVTGLHSVRLCALPWTVDATVEVRDGRPVLTQLHIQHEGLGITASSLKALPIGHITMLAAHALWGAEETLYRALATPVKQRSRTADHYDRVWQVAGWATRSCRLGGPAKCVAQFWEVHERTARRWLAAAARRRA